MTIYQPTIGLEVHVELNTKSKMFCSCANDPNEKSPNINICPICTAQPGSLPVINKEAVKKVIKTGLALSCQIPEYSKFDRKNYFYPDLPKGYQISQYNMPLCKGGFLEVEGRKIKITRVHLEEDTGRLIHAKGKDYSLVDFNRAGIPLMELVTEPDLKSAIEAKKFSQELQLILRYLGISDADMEKGEMRVEANISLGQNEKLGTKVEIKNLNSFRAVEKGINYEIERQTKVLKSGKKVLQETCGWNNIKGETIFQREKEESHDYRYFSEPDLPPLHNSKKFINEIRAEVPELPQQKRERFKKEYKLEDKEIEIFVQNKDLGEYFEKAMSELINWVKKGNFFQLTKLCSNYLITDLLGILKTRTGNETKILSSPFIETRILITPENFAEFISIIYKGEVSSKIAKIVLLEMFKTGADPSHIIKEKGLIQITDKFEIEKIIKEVVLKNQKAVEDFKKGKENAFQYLIGKVMAETKGKANPQIVSDTLRRTLTKSK